MARRILTIFLLCLLSVPVVRAQSDLAAILMVEADGVFVQRVGTSAFLPVSVEAIVGVGDTIRTNETGRARITFFADGVDTTLTPGTEYRIEEFSGDDTTFQLTVAVLAGQTIQRLERLLDPESSYRVITPGASLAARGTAFAVRVEDDGRSAMIVTEGLVSAEKPEADAEAEVASGFGVRAPVDAPLSDVVRATNFAELDAALDGCDVALSVPDGLRVTVRTGAALDYPFVGTLAGGDISRVKGVSEDGRWYRVDFRGGFGWILPPSAELAGSCAGLRSFEENFGPEDPTTYAFLGDPVDINDILTPSPDPTTPPPVEGNGA